MTDDERLKFLALKYGKEGFSITYKNHEQLTYTLIDNMLVLYRSTENGCWYITQKGWDYLETI